MFLALLGPVSTRYARWPFPEFELPSHRGRTSGRSREERKRTASRGNRGGGLGTKCRTPQPHCISGDLHNFQHQEKTVRGRKGFLLLKNHLYVSMVNSCRYKTGHCNLLCPHHNFYLLYHVFIIVLITVCGDFNDCQNDKEEASVFW